MERGVNGAAMEVTPTWMRPLRLCQGWGGGCKGEVGGRGSERWGNAVVPEGDSKVV